MRSQLRLSLVTCGLLSLLVLPGIAAHAAPIDNSVDIDWQNKRFLVGSFTTTGGLFIASLDDLADLVITIAIETLSHDIELPDGTPYEAYAADDVAGFELLLYVGSDLAEIEALALPQLNYGAGEDPVRGRTFDHLFEPEDPKSHTLELHLSDFAGYDDLVVRMGGGSPLMFYLDGGFFGSVNAGGLLPECDADDTPDDWVCPVWPGKISVDVSGGTAVPPPPVPEPSSLALLLVGGPVAAAIRRRRRG